MYGILHFVTNSHFMACYTLWMTHILWHTTLYDWLTLYGMLHFMTDSHFMTYYSLWLAHILRHTIWLIHTSWHTSLYDWRELGRNEAEWTGKTGFQKEEFLAVDGTYKSSHLLWMLVVVVPPPPPNKSHDHHFFDRWEATLLVPVSCAKHTDYFP